MSAALLEGWLLARSAPGAWGDPAAIDPAARWCPALVPGTVGASLRALDLWHPDDAVAFDAEDFWYRATLTGEGEWLLRLDGLATIADVFLDDRLVLHSENMFLSHELPVRLIGRHRLHLAFRSLEAWAAAKKGRARWRPTLVKPPALRWARTLLLGHIPGWGPPVHAVGPTRGLTLLPAGAQRVVERRISATLDGSIGLLTLHIKLSQATTGWVTARCGTVDFALVDDGEGWLRGDAEIPDVAAWWPHTHGTPALHPLTVFAGDADLPLGRIGFRTVAVDRDGDGKGFGLRVNGELIFCRGACWTSADIVTLATDRESILPILTLARDAGMNMVRVGGTMGYEGDDFFALCDELGLLVWQDFAFSNFDYPAGDTGFRDSVAAEARQLLARTQGSSALAVLCGGSEIAQQAAMLGMPPALWSNAIFDELLPTIAAELRPDLPYVPNSPWGGDLPFVAQEGISHYYGVSAHRRPIEDARRAHVRFSAESLGFANVPDVAPFALEADAPAIVHPDFVPRHAHDVAASWAFEGIRNHYTEALYGIDVAALRRDDPERFLAFARATSAEVMEMTYAEWRREGSPTRGALVWWLRDVFDGAGWGVIDARNAPKAAYWGVKRAFRPVSIVLTDEQLNGLTVSLINETSRSRRVTLTLQCLRDGATPVMNGSAELELEPRRTIALPASALWGGFFDTTYAFRFGEPSHDVTVARLLDANGALIAEAFHFPLGRGSARHELGLTADVRREHDGWQVTLAARRLAQSVRIRWDGLQPSDNYFHLAPGSTRTVHLHPLPGCPVAARGAAEALNGLASCDLRAGENELAR